jgi:hypothetical protein
VDPEIWQDWLVAVQACKHAPQGSTLPSVEFG